MNPARVLVVEDEALIRMTAVHIIEDAGYPVAEASNADDALVVLERNPDIGTVFTDVKMPGSICGIRLSQLIRDRWPPIHLVVTSGLKPFKAAELPEHVQFLAKPYSADQVTYALRCCAV
jgi:CheY-like chemotaxis protein